MRYSPLLLAGLISQAEPAFEKVILSDQYFCDGIAAGDLNRDGAMDIVAGPYCYLGPGFQKKLTLYPPVPLDPALSPSNSMFSFVDDIDGDGWLDVLVLGRVHRHQAFWYENPGTESQVWQKHFAFHRVKGESPVFQDIDGDGRSELLTHNERHWGFLRPDPAHPTREWVFTPFSESGQWPQFYHGMGLGDLNGDGLTDVLLNEGWYLQSNKAETGANWVKYAFPFSADRGGAQMFCYDIDGDTDADVVTSLNAHEWGLSWFENRGTAAAPFFMERRLMGTRLEEATYGVAFSQPHALEIADLNGDGLRDIVVGKRMWAHGPKGDVEPNAAPVIYWFELQRPARGRAEFRPHLIDDHSGVGVQIGVEDVDKDGRVDVLTASKLGAFLFLNRLGPN